MTILEVVLAAAVSVASYDSPPMPHVSGELYDCYVEDFVTEPGTTGWIGINPNGGGLLIEGQSFDCCENYQVEMTILGSPGGRPDPELHYDIYADISSTCSQFEQTNVHIGSSSNATMGDMTTFTIDVSSLSEFDCDCEVTFKFSYVAYNNDTGYFSGWFIPMVSDTTRVSFTATCGTVQCP